MAASADEGDHELIAAAQRGERGALDAFVRRHDRWVRGVVYATVGNPCLVDDVVQHVWTKVWQQIGTLADLSRWRGWLYRMAKHAAIDAGKQLARERRLRISLGDTERRDTRTLEPPSALAHAEDHRRVLDAIRALPALYREPFMLRHMEDWSYAKIGEALSLPIDTVETRLVRARRLLRSALAGVYENRKPKSDVSSRGHAGRRR